jgi:hypothetical protein
MWNGIRKNPSWTFTVLLSWAKLCKPRNAESGMQICKYIFPLKEIQPMISAHNDNVRLNEKLFARVKAVYEQRAGLRWRMSAHAGMERYKRHEADQYRHALL